MTRLDQLPRELIAQIGIEGDALSTLNLCTTCRAVRQACYNSFVFRSILVNSQQKNWPRGTLDIKAVSQRSGKSAQVWARYAVADQLAYMLWQAPKRNVNAGDCQEWAPELFVVKHPFLYHPCWRRYGSLHNSVAVEQKWCTTISTIAEETANPPVEEDFALLRGQTLIGKETLMNYVQALRWTVIELRKGSDLAQGTYILSSRRPVPKIATPRIKDLELAPKDLVEDLPVPFGNRTDWKVWNRVHSEALFDDVTDGVWAGYNTRFDFPEAAVPDDPAMTGIRFGRAPPHPKAPANSIAMAAQGCVKDKGGRFNIRGGFWQDSDGVYCFSGLMEHCQAYDSTRITLEWQISLRLTAFGLIGYWGRGDMTRHLNREGTLWLWKLSTKD